MITLYWLGAAAVFTVIEILTTSLTTIWFAGGALVAALLSYLGFSELAQVGVFILVSVLLLVLTRQWAKEHLNNRTVKTNADRLIGETCLVTETVENLTNKGQVTVKGQVWSARNVDEDQVLPKGTLVRIVAITGVKLTVQAVGEDEERIYHEIGG